MLLNFLFNLLAVQLQNNWAAIVAIPTAAVLIAVFTAVSVIVAVSIKMYRRKNNENVSNPHHDNNDKLTVQPNQAYGIAGAHELTVHPYDTMKATVDIYNTEYSYVNKCN